MTETTVAVIEKVTSKEGATNGKPWRKFSVKTDDGTFYSTFAKEVAEAAHVLEGQRAEIEWKTSGDKGQFKDITGAKAAGVATTPDGIPTARDDNGAVNWDEVGLRKTRCVLWGHFIDSPLAAAIAAKVDADGFVSDAVYRFGVALIECAERDIYWREPASKDSDIPFMPTIDGLGN